MVKDDLGLGRRNPPRRQRVAMADILDGVIGFSGPGHEPVTHNFRQVVGTELVVNPVGAVFLGKDPVSPVLEQFSLEEVAVGESQLLRFVDADHGDGDESDRVAEGPLGVCVPGQLHIEGTAAAHHFIEADRKLRMLRDILEVGH